MNEPEILQIKLGPNAEDLTGRRFGNLVVLYPNGKYSGTKPDNYRKFGYTWLCQCDCGKLTTGISCVLKRGKKISCGCKYNCPETHKKRGLACRKPDASYRHAYNQYKWKARSCKRVFELTPEEFKVITLQNCYYCGEAPNAIKLPHSGTKHTWHLAHGIDRVDNNVGYIRENCVTCCKLCNRLKSNQTLQEFLDRCRTIAERFPHVASVTG